MTKEEAKEIIEDIKYSLDSSLIGTPEIKEIDNAMAMAIKSLEAWDKVEADILGLDGYYDDAFWDGVNLVSDIINKHLSEVSE